MGLVIRGWRLLRLLGVGPLTAAYEARREGAVPGAGHVTLKLMVGPAAGLGALHTQFIRGAYAANRFRHPRVLPVLGDGVDEGGAPFVVRAWAEAEPLHTWLANTSWTSIRRLMPARALLRIAEQVLDAIEIAHAHGIVHAAVSPHNILVTPRGTVRLCDFASPPGSGLPAVLENDVLSPIRIGPFTAPERREAAAVPPNEQGDVYAVGACLLYALTGSTPADLSIGDGPVLGGGLAGEALAEVVNRAIARDPGDRYPSAYAMLGDVRRVMAGRPPKLVAAERPVPTGRLSSSLSPVRPETGQFEPSRASVDPARQVGWEEWRGNVLLILAILALVSVATLVVVRERAEDTRTHPALEGELVR